MNADAKKKHIEKIRALRNKTVENGCSPEEAQSASRLAAELMHKYDVGLSDLEMRESEFAEYDHAVADDVGQRLWKVAQAIGELTGCKSWVDRLENTRKVTFFGRDSDVEVASYLLAIAERATRDALKVYTKEIRLYRDSIRRSKRHAFLDGMINELAAMIREITWLQKKATGTGLVVLKEQLVRDELDRRGMKFTTGTERDNRNLEPSYNRGRSDGRKVQFEAGLGGGSSPTTSIDQDGADVLRIGS